MLKQKTKLKENVKRKNRRKRDKIKRKEYKLEKKRMRKYGLKRNGKRFNQLNEIQCIFNFFLFLLIQADSFQSLTDQWKYDIDLSNN